MAHQNPSRLPKRVRVLEAVGRVLGVQVKPKGTPSPHPSPPLKASDKENARFNSSPTRRQRTTKPPHQTPPSSSPTPPSSSSYYPSQSRPSTHSSTDTPRSTNTSTCPESRPHNPICFVCVAEFPSKQWTGWNLFADHVHGVIDLKAWCESCGVEWSVERVAERGCERHWGEGLFRVVHGDGGERESGFEGGEGRADGGERQDEWRYTWTRHSSEEQSSVPDLQPEQSSDSDDAPLPECPEYRHLQMAGPFCLRCVSERGGKSPKYCCHCAAEWCWQEAVSGFYGRHCEHEGDYVIAFHGGPPA